MLSTLQRLHVWHTRRVLGREGNPIVDLVISYASETRNKKNYIHAPGHDLLSCASSVKGYRNRLTPERPYLSYYYHSLLLLRWIRCGPVVKTLRCSISISRQTRRYTSCRKRRTYPHIWHHDTSSRLLLFPTANQAQ
jgi:hypothetical protein